MVFNGRVGATEYSDRGNLLDSQMISSGANNMEYNPCDAGINEG